MKRNKCLAYAFWNRFLSFKTKVIILNCRSWVFIFFRSRNWRIQNAKFIPLNMVLFFWILTKILQVGLRELIVRKKSTSEWILGASNWDTSGLCYVLSLWLVPSGGRWQNLLHLSFKCVIQREEGSMLASKRSWQNLRMPLYHISLVP